MSESGTRYQLYSIELDCPPGPIRPKDIIGDVIKGTGIRLIDLETSPPFFGHQIWVLKFKAAKDELFLKSKPIFKERIEGLYHNGIIRYGTW